MGVRKVASAEGVKRYKLPKGSIIGKGKLGSRGGSLVGIKSNGRISIGRTAKAHLDGIRATQKPDPADLPKKDTGGANRSAAVHLKNIKAGKSKGGREKNPYSTSGSGNGADREYTALTNAEYKAHTANVERLVKANMHLATEKQHATKVTGPDGQDKFLWTPERKKMHDAIIERLWKEQNADKVPNDGKGLVSGGLGGAGKSTVLGDHAGVDQSQYVTANPDDVKEILATMDGALPEIEGLSKMEMAALMHEESSDIAMRFAERAYEMRKNLTWDITMASPKSVADRLDQFKANGYTEVDAVFVDIPVETSVQRALDRHTRGLEAHRQGKGLGGRYVPPEIIRKNVDTTGKYSSKNRATFESLKDRFNSWGVWDNSVKGRPPVLINGTGRWAQGKKTA